MPSNQREQSELTVRQFIRNELEMGITFASLARNSQTDEKWQRTRQKARNAYDTANHFFEQHPAGEVAEQHGLLVRMTTLRHLLLELGETFE